MRFYLVIMMCLYICYTPFPVRAQPEDGAIRQSLISLTDSIRQSEERLSFIDTQLDNLYKTRNRLATNMAQARFNLVKSGHSLYSIGQRPVYLSFLSRHTSFLEDYYIYRTHANRVHILSIYARDIQRQYQDMDQKINQIEQYKHDRQLLSLSIAASLEQLETLSSLADKNTPALNAFHSIVKDMEIKNTVLNRFIESLMSLPPLDGHNTDTSMFNGIVLPSSGIIDRLPELRDGVSIRTRPHALVIAPAAGEVLYADRFKHSGVVIIIRHAGGYVSLLRGFQKLFVTTGQIVKQNAPLGTVASEQNTGENSNGAMLYYALRYNGETVDPLNFISGL